MNSLAVLVLVCGLASCKQEDTSRLKPLIITPKPRPTPKATASSTLVPIPTHDAKAVASTRPSVELPKRASRPIRCDDEQKCFYIDAFGLSYRIPKDAKIVLSGHEAADPLW